MDERVRLCVNANEANEEKKETIQSAVANVIFFCFLFVRKRQESENYEAPQRQRQ